ncbi:MAG: cysteine dioxygenase [Candidatus Latescibacterota bacterium]|jgi:cysteine dioxygenase
MDTIESLDELIKILKLSDPTNYSRVARRIQLSKSEFEKFTHWKSDGYSRNCIERTDVFELILICWDAGACTPVHAHDEQRCWVYQVDGKVNEVRFIENEAGSLVPSRRLELTPGNLSYMHDEMGYHALENKSETTAMSLHLYVSPIDSCQVFDTAATAFKNAELDYYSYKGVLEEANISK